jgi:hypothetical protein
MRLLIHDANVLLDLIDTGLLDPDSAIEKLERLMILNSRLPQSECSRLIESWRRAT